MGRLGVFLAAAVSVLAAASAPLLWNGKPPLESATSEAATSEGLADLVIEIVYVGGGEAIVVHFGEEVALIDVARPDTFQRFLLPHLEADGIRRLETLVVSHAHDDHAGGCAEVLERFEVARLIHPGTPWEDADWQRCLQTAAQQDVELVSANDLAPGAHLPFLPPLTAELLSADFASGRLHPDGTLNEGSLVFRLVHGKTSILFTGDAYCSTEEAILRAGLPVEADVLKLGHHGNEKTSTCGPWLRAVHPDVAIASRSTRLVPSLLGALGELGIVALDTHRHGNLTLTSDGEGWRFASEKGFVYTHSRAGSLLEGNDRWRFTVEDATVPVAATLTVPGGGEQREFDLRLLRHDGDAWDVVCESTRGLVQEQCEDPRPVPGTYEVHVVMTRGWGEYSIQFAYGGGPPTLWRDA